MRKKIIAGNWKMNKTAAQTAEFLAELKPLAKDFRGAEIVVCVPFTSLAAAKKGLKGSRIALGAQNIAWAEAGAFTGEVSGEMLNETGARYAIVGHSERRQLFGESDQSVNLRALAALKAGIKPIICVGETWEQRESGQTNEVLKRQTEAAFAGIAEADIKNVVVAYEPVWAIGTGKTATSEDANESIKYIRGIVKKLISRKAANALRILYGGSMNAGNAGELLSMSDIDGGLIGGSSLKAVEFSKCFLACNK